jgi:CheY-like chemotaxis protein
MQVLRQAQSAGAHPLSSPRLRPLLPGAAPQAPSGTPAHPSERCSSKPAMAVAVARSASPWGGTPPPQPTHPHPPPAPAAAPEFPSGLRILLLDADADARRAAGRLLADLGYARVTPVAAPAAALAALAGGCGRGGSDHGSSCGGAGAGGGGEPATGPFDLVLAAARTVGLGGGAAASSAPTAAPDVAAAAAAAGAALVLMGDARDAGEVMAGLDLGADDFLEARPLSRLKLQNLWQHTVRREMRRLGIGPQRSGGGGAAAGAASSAGGAPTSPRPASSGGAAPPPRPAKSGGAAAARPPPRPRPRAALRRSSSEGAALAAAPVPIPVALAPPGSPPAWLAGGPDDPLLCALDDADLAVLEAFAGAEAFADDLDAAMDLDPFGDAALLSSPLAHAVSHSDASCATALAPPPRPVPLHRSASAPAPATLPLAASPAAERAPVYGGAPPPCPPHSVPPPWMCAWPQFAHIYSAPPPGCGPGVVWGLPVPVVVTAPGLPPRPPRPGAPAPAPAPAPRGGA